MKKIARPKNKIIKKIHLFFCGKLIIERIDMDRKNRIFKKKQEEKMGLAMKNMIIHCSKSIPPRQHYYQTHKLSDSELNNNRDNKNDNRNDDSGSYAYQTNQLF